MCASRAARMAGPSGPVKPFRLSKYMVSSSRALVKTSVTFASTVSGLTNELLLGMTLIESCCGLGGRCVFRGDDARHPRLVQLLRPEPDGLLVAGQLGAHPPGAAVAELALQRRDLIVQGSVKDLFLVRGEDAAVEQPVAGVAQQAQGLF